MAKRKRDNATRKHPFPRKIVFDYVLPVKPRGFTHHLSSLVRYPQLINDIGRSVDVRRLDDNRYYFEVRQKRYLGRGTYAISAIAKGEITYHPDSETTVIDGTVEFGKQYSVLLCIMTLFVLLSLPIIFVTPLYIPLALLLLSIIALHWFYLRDDQHDVLYQLDQLVDVIHAETHLQDIASDTVNTLNSTQPKQAVAKY